jgi:ribosomal protein S18 acetylase RimI-like enzyme
MEKTEVKYKVKTVAINEIMAHLKECNCNFIPPLTERANIERYSRKIFENSITFEAWRGNLLIGLLAVYLNKDFDRSAFITNVSVLKDFMGLGIASTLLSKCIEYAVEEGYREIKLEVHKDNSRAIGLYRRFNFIIDNVDKDLLEMKIELFKVSMNGQIT